VFDFVRGLLSAFEAGLTRVVIDDMPGEGIGSVLHVQWAGAELAVPCYPGMTNGDVGAWLQRVKPDDFSVSDGEGRV
jgi:hypothetical protein